MRNCARKHSANGGRDSGLAQLTLVEHALCPLNRAESLRPNQTHRSSYFFTDKQDRRTRATATVSCPKGLSPNDEFILWGLLAITFAQREVSSGLCATPHFCLRQLGSIDSGNRRGGKNYRLFRESLSRLAAVTYQNDGFFDPLRGEHCEVNFGFLSYRLPLSNDDLHGSSRSSRVWRINWDPVFFEFCLAARGSLTFDLPLYRGLDPASRRLFLLLQKVFWRRKKPLWFDVRHLAVDVLGFSETLSQSDLNRKLRQSASRLADRSVIRPASLNPDHDWITRNSNGRFTVRFHRGDYFTGRRKRIDLLDAADCPLVDPLRTIGLDDSTIRRVRLEYSQSLLLEWADITLAAIELRRPFRRSPQAFFMDNVKNARDSGRTPPDWWHVLRRAEEQRAGKDSWKSLRACLGASSDSEARSTDHQGPVRVRDILR